MNEHIFAFICNAKGCARRQQKILGEKNGYCLKHRAMARPKLMNPPNSFTVRVRKFEANQKSNGLAIQLNEDIVLWIDDNGTLQFDPPHGKKTKGRWKK